MADELTPITRLEGILAGQDIQPITRLEYFLKQYAGGGGSGGGALDVNMTLDESTGKLVCDKTAAEMYAAFQNGEVIISINLGTTSYVSRVISVAIRTDEINYYTFAFVFPDFGVEAVTAAGDNAYPSANA